MAIASAAILKPNRRLGLFGVGFINGNVLRCTIYLEVEVCKTLIPFTLGCLTNV